MTIETIFAMAGTMMAIIGTMLALLRHYQESARRREMEIKRRIDHLEKDNKQLNTLYGAVREEMHTQFVRDHELRELRSEMREQFTALNDRWSRMSERIGIIGAYMERLIGRLEGVQERSA